ncbi:hypothetical protein AAY473_003919 [Plecturocebus cupreus]
MKASKTQQQMGFHHVGQAGLELLNSGDPPALASKVLGLQTFIILVTLINSSGMYTWSQYPSYSTGREHQDAQEASGQHTANRKAERHPPPPANGIPTGSRYIAQAGLELLVSSCPPASASLRAGTIGTYHHIRLIFVFLVEMGFQHIGQDDLDLLTS